jgi:dipeptidyl aminopeptidase/acylaminoacyl peptidase
VAANPRWLPAGDAVVFEADEQGHRPLFRVDLATDAVTRLTAEGAYTDVCVAPDGGSLYALHATVATPPRPVRLDASGPDQQPSTLPSPVGDDPAGARRTAPSRSPTTASRSARGWSCPPTSTGRRRSS